MAVRKNQRALDARRRMRERLAHQERLLDSFFTAEEAVEAARRRYDEAVARAQAGLDIAASTRASALAELAEALGSTREAAELTGASAREVRDVRKGGDRAEDRTDDGARGPVPREAGAGAATGPVAAAR